MSRSARFRLFVPVGAAIPALLLAAACEPAPKPPSNDTFAAARVVSGAAGVVPGTTLGATRQAGEPAGHGGSVWFTWTAPTSGVARLSLAGTFDGGELDVFSGGALTALRPLASSGDDFSGTSSAFRPEALVRVAAGSTYRIRVGGDGSSFSLAWRTSLPSSNDEVTAPADLTGTNGSVRGDSTGATAGAGDPQLGGQPAGATVWYRWTAPADGAVEFDTAGSAFDTVLGVVRADDPGKAVAGNDNVCSEDLISAGVSSLRFDAVAGTSYLVGVGSSGDDVDELSQAFGGRLQLNWRPADAVPAAPANDAFGAAVALSGGYGSISGDTSGASAEPGERAHVGSPAAASVWYSFTPAATADYLFTSALGRADDCSARVAVYTGSAVGGLTAVPEVASPWEFDAAGFAPSVSAARAGTGRSVAALLSDDSDSDDTRVVRLTAGSTYRVAVDTIDGVAAPFTLRWDAMQRPPGIRSVKAGDRSATVQWTPPAASPGTPRSGYLVHVIADDGSFGPEPVLVPVTVDTVTVKGLRNGLGYRVVVAALNSVGTGESATSARVVPAVPRR